MKKTLMFPLTLMRKPCFMITRGFKLEMACQGGNN